MVTMTKKYIMFTVLTLVNDVSMRIFFIITADNKYLLRKTKILVPVPFVERNKYLFCLMEGYRDILVYGFVRRICNKYVLRMISDDVLGWILMYYVINLLHCICIGGRNKVFNHWTVPVSFSVN